MKERDIDIDVGMYPDRKTLTKLYFVNAKSEQK